MTLAKKLSTSVKIMRISQSLCLNAPFRFFSDALWSSSFREQRLYGNFFLQLQNQMLLYKKFVDTLADPQCWMCTLISSMWRRLKERNMSLEILLSYQPHLLLYSAQFGTLAKQYQSWICTMFMYYWYSALILWLAICLQRRCVWPCWCSQQPIWQNYL